MAAEIYKGGVPFSKPGIRFNKNAGIFANAGTPTNGTSGTGAGKYGKATLCLDSTNGVVYVNSGTKASPTWVIVPFSAQLATKQTQPSNPTLTASATYVMMGLGADASPAVITPVGSTRIELTISGNITATNGQTATAQLSFGTGAAPANGAAVTGTQVGNQPTHTGLTAFLTQIFSIQAIITGLTVGTAYWLDLALKSSSGNVSVSNLSVTACEV